MESSGDAEASFSERGAHDDPDRSFELGTRSAGRGDLDAAEAAYRRADEAGHPTAAAYAGMFSEARGENTAAEAAYRRSDKRGDGFGAFRLGLMLSYRGDWEGAREAWRRADERGRDAPPFDLEALRGGGAPATAAAAGVAARERSAFANPVLIGAVTVLVLIIGVFLAYNANNGLPFVPTRELKVNIADGSALVVGNDVREGGFRIGLLQDMKPIQLSSGQVGAQLTLQLTEAHGQVPIDSRVAIRPSSVLGTKYVDLEQGSSSRVVPDGGTLPISRTSVPVQFDDIFKTFDPKTRTAIQRDLVGFGDTLAARGSALNDTISSLPALFGHLEPVARYLSEPRTELTRFFDDLNLFMGAVAPVSQTNAQLFGHMATTFEAISRDPLKLEQTISESPPTLDVSTSSLRVQQPFLVDFTTLGRDLTPATAALRGALPQLNPALEIGTQTLKRTPALNNKLQGVLRALRDLAQNPGTNIGLNALTATVLVLNPMLRYLGPFQTVCDGWNYWWTYLSEHLSEQTNSGFAQRAMINFADATEQNNVGQQGATAPAGTEGGPEFFHAPNYGAAVDNAGFADCETGQRGYPLKLNHLDPQGRNLDTDPHTPGDQGPTFHGRARVPAGETFSRNPQTGPQLQAISANP